MGFYRGPNIVTNGLVLNLDAANVKSYPGSGTTWTDLSGLNNNGTLTNGPTFNSANAGSIVFDGTNDYVNIGTPSLLNITTGDFSLEVFFYYQRSVSLYAKIASKGRYLTPGWTMYAGYDGTLDSFGFQYGSSVWTSVGDGRISENTWYHGFITRLNGTITAYLNGLSIGSAVDSYNFNAPSTNTLIGCNSNLTEPFKGRVSVFRQYSKGFTVTEVLQNYNATKSRFNL